VTDPFTPADKRWFKELLTDFAEVDLRSDTSARAQCPDPYGRHINGDRNPSLSLDLSQNGSGPTVLLHCRSQRCDVGAILDCVGKEPKDLYPSKNGKLPSALPGCTLEDYAESKSLPLDFLTHEYVGLKDTTYFCRVTQKNVPAVWIPYMDESGQLVALRYRTGLRKPGEGDDTRFRWEKGSILTLYGRNWLDIAKEAGYAFLVEGESDCHTGWYHNIPTVGVPGATNWKDEWAVCLDGIDLLIVTVEDLAGERLWEAASKCERLKERLERAEV